MIFGQKPPGNTRGTLFRPDSKQLGDNASRSAAGYHLRNVMTTMMFMAQDDITNQNHLLRKSRDSGCYLLHDQRARPVRSCPPGLCLITDPPRQPRLED